MKPLKIAVVCDGLTSMTGGAFISALRFARLLSSRGHAVVIFTSRRPGERAVDEYESITTYRFSSILVPKTERQLYMALPRTSHVKDVLAKEDIDVVHIASPTPLSIAAIRAAKSLGLNIVSHSHTQPENIFLHLPKFTRLKPVYWIFNRYLLWFYRSAAYTICPSDFSEKTLDRVDDKLNTVVISNGVDTFKFKRVSADPFIEKFGIPKDSKRLLFVGRMHPEKRVDTLIRSVPYILKEWERAHVIIVGSGYLLERLKNLAKELGVEKNVTFCGKVSDEELIMAYSSCDIFAFPSLAELEGMAVLEAMSCGNPVLIANSKESASVDFVDGNGSLFAPDNPKDLAEKALKILRDETLRQSMARTSVEISRDYDINKSVDTLEKLYYSFDSLR